MEIADLRDAAGSVLLLGQRKGGVFPKYFIALANIAGY
jgi:hypothetical protein